MVSTASICGALTVSMQTELSSSHASSHALVTEFCDGYYSVTFTKDKNESYNS